MKRRVFTRRKAWTLVTAYVLAGFCILGGFWRISHNRAEDYKRQITNTYRHAFTELASEVGQMDAALQKLVCAGTPAMISGVCTDVYGKASAAKYALGELPVSGGEFEKTCGFITRVGDYAYALSRKAGAGEAPGDEDYANLKSLADTASVLSGNLTQLLARLDDGELTLDGLYRTQREAALISEAAASTADASGLTGGLKLVEGEFPEIPTLIYDGPFSTHIAGLKPKMLEGEGAVIGEQAALVTADFLGISRKSVKYDGERGGDLPVHMLSASIGGATVSVEVSKMGGEIVNMFSSRIPRGDAISQKDAVAMAERFLHSKGYRNMKVTYHMTEDDTVLVNFAYIRDSIICYPDLIGVRVARDKGDVVAMQRQGFVMNHHEREIPKVEVSEEAAREKVSPHLTVLTHELAIIPTAGKNEAFCHEFKCETEDGRHVIVYINAVTGAEEKILLLQETESGTLAV